jgi:hypothetical protein
MPPLLCVDSDIFTLMAAAGRLDRLPALAGVAPDAIRRLAALPHMLAKGKAFRDYPQAARDTALAAANVVPGLTERPTDNNTYNRLAGTPGIDPGEALLFAVMAEQPVYWLATADRRSLVSLATAAEVDDIRQRVAGRVVSFEAVFFRLVEADGLAATAAAFAAVGLSTNPKVRTLIRAPGGDTELAGICSYLRDICRSTGGPGHLLHCPPCPQAAAGVCRL